MAERRTVIRDFICGAGLVLSGCSSTQPSPASTEGRTPETPVENNADSPTEIISRTMDPERLVSDWHGEPVVGSGDPLTLDREATRNASVPTDDATFNCRTVSAEAVGRQIDESLNNPQNIQVIARQTDRIQGNTSRYDGAYVLHAGRVFTAGDEGVVYGPNVSFAKFRDATPRSVATSIDGDAGPYTCSYDVVVFDVLEWLD